VAAGDREKDGEKKKVRGSGIQVTQEKETESRKKMKFRSSQNQFKLL